MDPWPGPTKVQFCPASKMSRLVCKNTSVPSLTKMVKRWSIKSKKDKHSGIGPKCACRPKVTDVYIKWIFNMKGLFDQRKLLSVRITSVSHKDQSPRCSWNFTLTLGLNLVLSNFLPANSGEVVCIGVTIARVEEVVERLPNVVEGRHL